MLEVIGYFNEFPLRSYLKNPVQSIPSDASGATSTKS